MKIFLLGFYRFFIRPLALVLMPILKAKFPKIKKGMEERRLFEWDLPSAESRIWLHCASGEFEYARDVLRQIKVSHPNSQTLVTYLSPSYKKWIQKSKNVDAFGPLPLDTKKETSKFLEAARPDVLGIARTDIWPELLIQCRRRNIPILLFSKSIPDNQSWFQRITQNTLLDLVDQVFLVSQKDSSKLSKALQSKCSVVGDSRYDQCLKRKSESPNLPSPNSNKKSLLLASLWPGDEKILSPQLEKLAKDYHIIWVPHEPHKDDFFRLQKKFPNLRTLPFSQTKGGTDFKDHDILLVDEVGYLADLFQWAHLSFIGGSFDRQVHSVMESLAWGVPALVGPKHKKNGEALEFKSMSYGQNSLRVVCEIRTSQEFQTKACQYLENWTSKESVELIESFKKKSGASKKIAQWLVSATHL